MNWKIIFNPFEKISEKWLLFLGFITLLAGSSIGDFFEITYDTYFSIHLKEVSFVESLSENLLNISTMTLVMFIAGKLINQQTRIVDVLNVSMIARTPLYIAATLANNKAVNRITERIIENINNPEKIKLQPADTAILILFSTVIILFLLISVTILFLGFKTAVNAKKANHYLLFLVALAAAEIFISLIHLSLKYGI